MQTSTTAKFKGPLDCLLKTVGKEGFRGLYKGATPPLVGWMFMDSMYASSFPNLRYLTNKLQNAGITSELPRGY